MDYHDYEEYDFIRMTTSFRATSAILVSILVLFAICGNTATIIAYNTDKRLHTVYDFFIFNLAAADLLIGCISMPFYAIYTLKEFVWDFGDVFCKVWNVIDFTLCLESILLILLLSFDRLCLVKYGPLYSSKMTKLKAKLLVIISWISSFLLYGPAITGWNYWVGYTTVEPLDCDVEFAYNFVFTTTTAIIEFVIPVVGLAIMNIMIYQHIKSRIGNSIKAVPKQAITSTVSTEDHKAIQVKVEQLIRLENENINKSTIEVNKLYTSDIPNIVVNGCEQINKEGHDGIANGNDSNCVDISEDFVLGTSGKKQSKISFASIPKQSARFSFFGTLETDFRRKSKNKSEHSRIKRDTKAARFLAILVLVFLTCWAPYTITTIIISFCGNDCVNTSVYESMNWLLWSKSAINPFLYAINSSRYRYHFKKYIFCCKNQVHPTETETTCQTAG